MKRICLHVRHIIIFALIIVCFPDFSPAFMNPPFPSQTDPVVLPQPRLSSGISVEESLQNRRSVRDFKSDALTLEEVSQLLWAAYGITEEKSSPAFLRGGLRTAPSAGALYPLEIYLVCGNVTGLPKGIFRYLSEEHSLQLVSAGDVRSELAHAALDQDFVATAPVSIVFTAVYSRTTQKYGSRGRERFVCMDLGHSAQAVGAFTNKMVSLVMLLPAEEEPLYIMPVGKY